ncbi:MAG: tRNA (adenosine(37)-N6)-dimethylallyltransferase MiaA [Lachnospiraceae bacterium]|nr:tRNA (adenosine(37)-N6)-dimethylallyltransferase MiaA [Lachnospiraceae bacterium]
MQEHRSLDFTGERRPLIVLTGPTAVGKTKLSLSLARAVNGEIISADSMQVYRGMDIGTAKIAREEREGIPHHLIDVLEPEEEFNVVLFQKLAGQAMEGIYSRGRIPVLVGGTGFYIQAVTNAVDFTESETDTEYRRQLEQLAAERGAAALHELLAQADPAAAAQIHENNIKRTIRALEYHRQTGGKISEHNALQRSRSSPFELYYFVLTAPREVLYERIDRRVDEMLAAGLCDEVRRLRERGCARSLVSMQGLGYRELFAWLKGELTLEEAADRIKRNTRHFAKRQLTWFKREKQVIWLDKSEFGYDDEKILEEICGRQLPGSWSAS